MSDINPNCDGGHCRDPKGEVRVYPLGSGGNLILCRACWEHENEFNRYQQNKHFAARELWPTRDWETAKQSPEETHS